MVPGFSGHPAHETGNSHVVAGDGVHRAIVRPDTETNRPIMSTGRGADEAQGRRSSMFERFTDRARLAVVQAQEEARRLGHDHLGPEHLLLSLTHESIGGVGTKALESLGISPQTVRQRVEEVIGRGTQGSQASSGHIPFTQPAKNVLQLALREALQLDHRYIGTEHLLLGLLREGEGVPAQVLTELGADLAGTRAEVVRLLNAYRHERGPGSG